MNETLGGYSHLCYRSTLLTANAITSLFTLDTSHTRTSQDECEREEQWYTSILEVLKEKEREKKKWYSWDSNVHFIAFYSNFIRILFEFYSHFIRILFGINVSKEPFLHSFFVFESAKKRLELQQHRHPLLLPLSTSGEKKEY